MAEDGLNTPRRSAPLARGGRTNGNITTVCKINFPLNSYRARQYAIDVPKKIRISVEIVEVIKLKMKALSNCGLIKESINFDGSKKFKILIKGKPT
jgi:hypothetical protein